jgi:hypothetical protein
MARQTRQDERLGNLQKKFFPNSKERQWPPTGAANWFMGPRALPVILQILTNKEVTGSAKGSAAATYIELLSRVRPPAGIIDLGHPEDHAKIIGYSRKRSWLDAMRQLRELGFIETERGHGREFGYALIVNPYVAVKRLREQKRIDHDLWHLFSERWDDTGAAVLDASTAAADEEAAEDVSSDVRTMFDDWVEVSPKPGATKKKSATTKR